LGDFFDKSQHKRYDWTKETLMLTTIVYAILVLKLIELAVGALLVVGSIAAVAYLIKNL